MRLLRLTALVLAVVILCFSASSCGAEPVIKIVKKGICAIPESAEALRTSVESIRRYEDCRLGQRTSEVVGEYLAADCAVLVRKLVYKTTDDIVTGFVADVYIDSMEQFIGYVCRDEKGRLAKKPAGDAIADTNALLLINADFLTARSWGLYVRAGNVVRSEGTKGVDLCTIDTDGVMRIEDGDHFDGSAAMGADKTYHIFSFGPSLLNADGSPRNDDGEFHITDKYSKWNSYDSTVGFPMPNPRTAIGQAKDGHFIFVTVDGRMWRERSRGVTFPELSHILYEEGAVVAYNMDGGGSEIMVFKGEELTKQYKEEAKRIPSDYICICSAEYGKNEA